MKVASPLASVVASPVVPGVRAHGDFERHELVRHGRPLRVHHCRSNRVLGIDQTHRVRRGEENAVPNDPCDGQKERTEENVVVDRRIDRFEREALVEVRHERNQIVELIVEHRIPGRTRQRVGGVRGIVADPSHRQQLAVQAAAVVLPAGRRRQAHAVHVDLAKHRGAVLLPLKAERNPEAELEAQARVVDIDRICEGDVEGVARHVLGSKEKDDRPRLGDVRVVEDHRQDRPVDVAILESTDDRARLTFVDLDVDQPGVGRVDRLRHQGAHIRPVVERSDAVRRRDVPRHRRTVDRQLIVGNLRPRKTARRDGEVGAKDRRRLRLVDLDDPHRVVDSHAIHRQRHEADLGHFGAEWRRPDPNERARVTRVVVCIFRLDRPLIANRPPLVLSRSDRNQEQRCQEGTEEAQPRHA